MFKKPRFHAIFAIASILLLLISTAPLVLAQADTTANIEIIGQIDIIERGALTVNGVRVDTQTADIQTALAIDALVKVEALLMGDGTIVAREVYAAEAGLQPGEIELDGTLETLSLIAAQVSGISLDVSTAEVQAGIVIGDRVKVHAQLSPEGVWIAREIELDGAEETAEESSSADTADGEDFKIIGTLDSINDDGTLTIGGQVVDVSGAEIEDTLVIGALVKVEVQVINGVVTASEVERSRTFLLEDNDNDNLNDNDDDDDFNDNDGNDDDDDENENAALNSNETCVPSVPAGWTTYTVRSGDTLSAIAAGSGSSVSELSATNCIPDARVIQIGQQIAVPRAPVISSVNVNSNDDDDDNDNDDYNDNDDDDDYDNDNYNDNDDDDDNDNDNYNDNDDDDDNYNDNESEEDDNSNDNEADDD